MGLKFSVCFLIFVISAFLVSSVYGAGWTKSYDEGYWTVCDWGHWEDTLNDRTGTARWYLNTGEGTNFTGFHLELNVTEFEAWRKAWWWLRAEKNIDVVLKFRNLTESTYHGVNLWINLKRCEESWGFFHDYWVFVGTAINSTEHYDCVEYRIRTQDELKLYPSFIEVFINRTDNDFCIWVLNRRLDTEKPVLLFSEKITFHSTWFNEVSINMFVRHTGQGSFKAGHSDPEVYNIDPYNPDIPETQGIPPYTIWTFVKELAGILTSKLPAWFQEWISVISGYFTVFYDMASQLWDTFISTLPILPFLVLFWFLDAIGSSVMYGKLEPMGKCVTTIFNTIRGIISMVIDALHTIYDFIHFW